MGEAIAHEQSDVSERSREILTVEEAAALLRLSTSAVYRALREGRLPGFKVLGRWRLRKADLDDLIANRDAAEHLRGDADPMPRGDGRMNFRAELPEPDVGGQA